MRHALVIIVAGGIATGAVAQAQQSWEPYSAGLQARAAAGEAAAQFALGEAYRTGNGIGPDREQALAWYRKAAPADVRAADALGVLLFTKGERKEAIPLLMAAAGRRNVYALYILGTARFNGDYVPKDMGRAYADMRIAAASLPQAARSLGLMESYLSAEDRARADILAGQPGGPEAGAPAAPAYALAPQPRPLPAPPVRTVTRPAAVPQRSANMTALSGAVAALPPTASDPAPATMAATPIADVPPPAARTPAPVRIAAAKPKPAIVPPKTSPAVAEAKPATTAGTWRVQLGAYASETVAEGQWKALVAKVAALGKLAHVTESAGTLVRLQATGLADGDAAKSLCDKVTAAGGPCLALRR